MHRVQTLGVEQSALLIRVTRIQQASALNPLCTLGQLMA